MNLDWKQKIAETWLAQKAMMERDKKKIWTYVYR